MVSINRLQHYPISDNDILKVLDTNVIKYSNLQYVKKIDDILRNDSLVILIESNNSPVGHWVCIVKHNNTLSYFDSYGRPPDPDIYLDGGNTDPYLSKLLLDSPYDLEYNEYDYQARGVSTCGRHCIVRIIMKDKSLEDYNEFMRSFKDDDALVSAITMMIKK